MKIIILNCGSSSIKYQLINMPEEQVLAKGLVEKIALDGSRINHENEAGQKTVFENEISDHQTGMQTVLDILVSKENGSLQSLSEIDAVGHRVVHGGEDFSGSVPITDAVIAALEKNVELAPLHNPPNLEGIYTMQRLLPDVPQVGVFDTAFHQSMPEHVYLYAVPYVLYEKYKVRRFGFHGTSHKYVSARACDILGVDINQQKIITCHLGNGASVAAIKNGKSFDTSMGMTPAEGLIMGTRTGDIDPGALLYMAEKEETSIKETSNLLNKKSGMLGISGISSDMRDIEIAADDGNHRAQLALEMYAYRAKKYIGAYAAALGGVDLIVFTGGIGENDPETRKRILKGLEFMGIKIKHENAASRGQEILLTAIDSKVCVLVVPTKEELMIAKDTYQIISE
ncbi:MAG: acetate kinase [Bacteroidales bacterium]|nr:acetate kinase [Bacteroidales bacterium]